MTLSDGAPVILALDGRPGAAGAIRFAEALNRRHGNDVRVTTVVEPLPAYLTRMELYPDEAAPRRVADARKAVTHRVQYVLGREYDWPVAAVGGRVDDAVAAVAQDDAAAAVVIGIGQHHTIDHWLGGETSVRILARSSVPVIAVPEWVTTLPRTAVVGTDFGPASLVAAQTALDCLASPAALTLLHVLPDIDSLLAGPDTRVSYRQALAARFQSMIGALQVRPGVEITIADTVGNPVGQILAYAERLNADLAAVGSQGFDRLDPRMIGTVASHLLRAARCTVIVAPDPRMAS